MHRSTTLSIAPLMAALVISACDDAQTTPDPLNTPDMSAPRPNDAAQDMRPIAQDSGPDLAKDQGTPTIDLGVQDASPDSHIPAEDMAPKPPPTPGTCPPPQGQQTHLEAAVASLAAGQACTLASDLYGEVTRPDKNYESAMTWSASAAWIEPARQLRWTGRPAGCNSLTRPFVHLLFDEQRNSWSHEILPTDEFTPCGHAYDSQTSDNAGNYYFRLWRDPYVRIRRADGTWTKTPDHGGQVCCMGMAYMDSLSLGGQGDTGGLVYITGASKLHALPQGQDAWTALTLPDTAKTNYHAIAEYNPTSKLLVFGGGNNHEDTILTMTPSGQITHLNTPPISFTVTGSGSAGAYLVADPASGHFVAIDKRDQRWYDLDAANDRWTEIPAPFPITSPKSIFHAAIPRHNVILFAEEVGKNKPVLVWIYKHAEP